MSEADSGEEEKDNLAYMDADAAPVPDSAVKAGWFSPARLLLLFCCINMMIYIDRGALCCSTCPSVRSQQLELKHKNAHLLYARRDFIQRSKRSTRDRGRGRQRHTGVCEV